MRSRIGFDFFPCFSEHSNLKFHIHAPFASTPARSEVKNTQANVDLLTNLADLIAECVLEIKQRGWLSIDFLSVLPNSNDNVPDFYKPIYDKILNVFRNNELLPLQNGGYGKCTDVFYSRNEKDIELFTDDDLCQLCDSERSWMEYWKDGSRITPFVKDITITHWNSETYLKYLQSQHIEKFLRNKSIGWLRKFYEMLNELIPRPYVQNRKNTIKILSESRIVRIQDGTHCSGLQCFFPPDDSSDTEGWKIIDRKLLPDGSDDRDKEHRKILRDFLETIGVNPLNKIERLKRILNEKYARPLQQPPEQYIKDLQLFIDYTESESKDASIFRDKYILFAANQSQSVCPPQIYVDNENEQSPLHTGLSAYYNQLIGKVDSLPLSLADIYKDILPEKLEAFLRKVGCIVELYINTQHWYGREYCQNPMLCDKAINQTLGFYSYNDYSIPHIELLSWNVSISRLLWNTITNFPKEVLFAVYRVYAADRNDEYTDSILVQQLRETPWIPQGREDKVVFVKPADAIVDQLPPGFPYEAESAWLKAIQFGQHAKNLEGVTDEQKKAILATMEVPQEFVDVLKNANLTHEQLGELICRIKETTPPKNTQRGKEEEEGRVETFTPRYPDPKDAPLRIYESAPPNVASTYSAPTSTTSVSKHYEKNDVDSNSESKDKQAVGRYGEQYAVLALQAEFPKDEGYEIRNLNSTGIGVGCDIEVHKNEEIVRIIEVKTTTASGEHTFNVSGTQWENGRREDDKFWLYSVFNAEDEPFLVKKQNPIKRWKAGELVAHPVGVIVKAIIPDGQ